METADGGVNNIPRPEALQPGSVGVEALLCRSPPEKKSSATCF